MTTPHSAVDDRPGTRSSSAGLPPPRNSWHADRAWVRSFWDALRPYAIGIGSYVNGMTEFEEDRVRASYGAAKYQRLARIKAEYDPDNVFHRNANIKPSQLIRPA